MSRNHGQTLSKPHQRRIRRDPATMQSRSSESEQEFNQRHFERDFIPDNHIWNMRCLLAMACDAHGNRVHWSQVTGWGVRKANEKFPDRQGNWGEWALTAVREEWKRHLSGERY